MTKSFPSGSIVRSFETLDSTSLEAKRLVASGETGPLWVIAKRQTGGYGRRGATWFQAEGDVAASFIFTPKGAAANAAQLSYAAALAVADAVRAVAGDVNIALKWPNDVLLDGAKLSGVLMELVTGPAQRPAIVFGAGVNILSSPEGLDYSAARLMDVMNGPPPTPLDFVAALDAAFSQWLKGWEHEGFAPLRAAWLNQAAHLGEEITVRLPKATRIGLFQGLDEEGALVLATDEGEEKITAGAVFFGDGHAASH